MDPTAAGVTCAIAQVRRSIQSAGLTNELNGDAVGPVQRRIPGPAGLAPACPDMDREWAALVGRRPGCVAVRVDQPPFLVARLAAASGLASAAGGEVW